MDKERVKQWIDTAIEVAHELKGVRYIYTHHFFLVVPNDIISRLLEIGVFEKSLVCDAVYTSYFGNEEVNGDGRHLVKVVGTVPIRKNNEKSVSLSVTFYN